MFLVQEHKSISTMKQFIASASWLHHLGGYPDPTKTSVVDTLLQSAYRQLAQPVTHKNPLTKEILQDIHDSMFISDNSINLTKLRDFSYIMLSFSGFLRFDEASKVKRSDIIFNYDYLVLTLPRSKTDPLNQGCQVYITRSSTDLCTFSWLIRFFKAAGIQNSDHKFIFRSIFHQTRSDRWGLRATNKPLSYTTLSEMFRNRLAQAGHDTDNFSLHSLRAGGVTLAASEGMREKMYKAHGRWKSEAVKSYVSESVEQKLSVTKALNL